MVFVTVNLLNDPLQNADRLIDTDILYVLVQLYEFQFDIGIITNLLGDFKVIL